METKELKPFVKLAVHRSDIIKELGKADLVKLNDRSVVIASSLETKFYGKDEDEDVVKVYSIPRTFIFKARKTAQNEKKQFVVVDEIDIPADKLQTYYNTGKTE